jgi:uncharacterized integral membrane protein
MTAPEIGRAATAIIVESERLPAQWMVWIGR